MLTNTIKNIINNITYPLRMRLALSRPIKNIDNEKKSDLFNSQKDVKEEKRLLSKYHLEHLQENSSIVHYKENLYILKLLEDILTDINVDTKKDPLEILDIGSKNFSYAPAIHHYFKHFNATQIQVKLDGIEIDPYRVLADLHSRHDYAQYYIRNLPQTEYIAGNLLDHTKNNYDIITWFLPFIIEEPLINWGLPIKYFRPKEMLKHAYKILRHRGIILLVNQGETEKEAQIKLIKELNLPYVEFEESYTNSFSPYKIKRYITIITKG